MLCAKCALKSHIYHLLRILIRAAFEGDWFLKSLESDDKNICTYMYYIPDISAVRNISQLISGNYFHPGMRST